MKRKAPDSNLPLLLACSEIDSNNPIGAVTTFKKIVDDHGLSSGEVKDFLFTKECLSVLSYETFWVLHQGGVVTFIEYVNQMPNIQRVSTRLRISLSSSADNFKLSFAADVCQYLFRHMKQGDICESILDHIFTYFDPAQHMIAEATPILIPYSDINLFFDIALILIMSTELQNTLAYWFQKHLVFIIHGVICDLPDHDAESKLRILIENIERIVGADFVARCVQDMISSEKSSIFDLPIRRIFQDTCMQNNRFLAITFFLNEQQVDGIVETSFKLAISVAKNQMLVRSLSFAELLLSSNAFDILINNLFGPLCSSSARGIRLETSEPTLDVLASEFLFLTLCEMIGNVSYSVLISLTNAVKSRRGENSSYNYILMYY